MQRERFRDFEAMDDLDDHPKDRILPMKGMISSEWAITSLEEFNCYIMVDRMEDQVWDEAAVPWAEKLAVAASVENQRRMLQQLGAQRHLWCITLWN